MPKGTHLDRSCLLSEIETTNRTQATNSTTPPGRVLLGHAAEPLQGLPGKAANSRIEEGVDKLECDIQFADTPKEIPEWLREYPIQRLLNLTTDYDMAIPFALCPRKFSGRKGC